MTTRFQSGVLVESLPLWIALVSMGCLNVDRPSTPGPTCTDRMKNGDETGVDCGGPVCLPCSCGTRLAVLNLAPAVGPVETPLTVTGVGFAAVTAVSLNGVAVPFALVSDTRITLRIPPGAGSGPVVVTAPCGSVASTVVFSVLRLAAQVDLASAVDPGTADTPIQLTATVTSSWPVTDTIKPGGNVLFREGTRALGIVALQDGVATFAWVASQAGEYTLSAEYMGDVDFTPARSASLSQSVLPSRPYLAVYPGVYDPDETGTVIADWVAGVALDGGGDNASTGLVLRKTVTTATPVAALAYIEEVAGLDAATLVLGFDYFRTGHCGSGAPRFNVRTSDGTTHFLGCAYGTHGDGPALGWERVSFGAADASPPLAAGTQVESVLLVLDEGIDTPISGGVVTPGYAILDNITVNQGVVGGP